MEAMAAARDKNEELNLLVHNNPLPDEDDDLNQTIPATSPGNDGDETDQMTNLTQSQFSQSFQYLV